MPSSGKAWQHANTMMSYRLLPSAPHAQRPGTRGTIARFYLSEWFDE
ncbi:hypothetical protein [Vreelandella stevensii]